MITKKKCMEIVFEEYRKKVTEHGSDIVKMKHYPKLCRFSLSVGVGTSAEEDEFYEYSDVPKDGDIVLVSQCVSGCIRHVYVRVSAGVVNEDGCLGCYMDGCDDGDISYVWDRWVGFGVNVGDFDLGELRDI